MAAFRRRTTFAAPLIVTVAASCSSKEAPPTTKDKDKAPPPIVEAPRPSWVVAMRDMKCQATEVVRGNPPAPQDVECPPGMTGNITMRIEQRPDGSCVAEGKHTTPCPLPPGMKLAQKLGMVWTIEKRGKDCHAEEEDHDNCPPGVDCNPPKPRTFPCPPGVTEEKPLHVAELPDATCVVVPDGCTDTGCATEKIACPPEGARK